MRNHSKLMFSGMALIFLFFFLGEIYGSELDSLKMRVDSLPAEKKATTYNRIFVLSGVYNFDSTALEYAELAKKWAEETLDTANLAFALRNIGFYYNSLNKFDEALSPYRQSLELLKSMGELRRSFTVYSEIADILMKNRKYDQVSEHFFDAIAFAEKNDYNPGLFVGNYGLGKLYRQLGDLDKAEKYFEITQELLEKNRKNIKAREVAGAFRSFGLLKMQQGRYEEAMALFEKSLEAQKSTGDERLAMMLNNSIAMVHSRQGNHELALDYYLKALEHGKKSGNKDLIAAALLNVGNTYLKTKDMKQAKKYLQEGLNLATEFGFIKWQRNAHEYLHSLYLEEGDYKKALEHVNDYHALDDSLKIEENKLKLAELETKYESEKKEKQIELLNKENELKTLRLKQNRRLLLIAVILVVVMLISAVNYLRSMQQKQRAREIIEKQEVEKRILSTVIATEDKERKRFAADLHDGLGPILSSIKLYLSGLQDATAAQQEEMISTADELIDQSIQTTRTISNNILPVELSEKGLVSSIQSFCNKIQHSQQLTFAIYDDFKDQPFESSTEIILYRVLQELINNTIKHAGANKVTIRFSGDQNNYSIEYSDNGIGFDQEELSKKPTEGMGLLNIRERIQSLGGHIDIQGKDQEGMKAWITLPI
jgi:two-component system NarL family sensor kinase